MTPLQLKTLRRRIGWGQQKTATACGWSRSKIQRHEAGTLEIAPEDERWYKEVMKIRRVK